MKTDEEEFDLSDQARYAEPPDVVSHLLKKAESGFLVDRMPIDDRPTNSVPGSLERQRVYADRLRRRVRLWHPLDAKAEFVAEKMAEMIDETNRGVHKARKGKRKG